jgi:transposase
MTKYQKNKSLEQHRGTVATLFKKGETNARVIARTTGIPYSTVTSQLRKLKSLGTNSPIKQTGRPKMLTPKKTSFIESNIESNMFLTAKKIQDLVKEEYGGFEPCVRTIRTTLNKLGYKYGKIRRAPLMTVAHKIARVAWAKTHRRYKKWNSVVFTDECSIQKYGNGVWVWYREADGAPEMAAPKHGPKLHLWGAFSKSGVVGLHTFTGILNADRFQTIVKEHLFDNAAKVVGKFWVLQQDNDPKHTARTTKALLKERCPEILPWPSASPDLNPIENLWAWLKKKVEKRIAELELSGHVVNQSDFEKIVHEAWGTVTPAFCESLVESMPKRCEAVIKANGNKIKY